MNLKLTFGILFVSLMGLSSAQADRAYGCYADGGTICQGQCYDVALDSCQREARSWNSSPTNKGRVFYCVALDSSVKDPDCAILGNQRFSAKIMGR